MTVNPATADDVVETLGRVASGDTLAEDQLWRKVYPEFRRMAHQRLRRAPLEGLDTTTLVHEAYLRLQQHNRSVARSKSYFFAAGARAIHRVLMDLARRRAAEKRGGDRVRVTLSEGHGIDHSEKLNAIAVARALDGLRSEFGERPYVVVIGRFLAGMTLDELAEIQGTSRKTVERDWTFAQAWLRTQLAGT